jgi:hypothetical protein
MDRKKLDTLIEKEVYHLVSNIKNHTQSFMHLAARKRGLKVDSQLLDVFNELLALGIEDGFQTQIDLFNQGIGKALDKYTAEENPTQHTSSGRGRKASGN